MRRIKIYWLSVLFLVVVANAANCAAQDKPDALTPKQNEEHSTQSFSTEKVKAPPGAPPGPSGQSSDPNAQQDENTKRILGFIPNFQSKDDIPQNQAPLRPREKYALAYHQTVDFSAHVGNAFQAALQRVGALRAAVRCGGSGPGHVSFFHFWLFAACVERRSPLLSKEIWLTVVSHSVRGHAHGDHAHRCWRSNL